MMTCFTLTIGKYVSFYVNVMFLKGNVIQVWWAKLRGELGFIC